jgi:TPP-dependent pyruvate/acetoin dehydrogenase alpha subunit
MRHYLGKAGGPMEGRDGNIHLGALDRGTIPMISHLPEMLPVGMGVALSRSRRGLASAALGFCGDGASTRRSTSPPSGARRSSSSSSATATRT